MRHELFCICWILAFSASSVFFFFSFPLSLFICHHQLGIYLRETRCYQIYSGKKKTRVRKSNWIAEPKKEQKKKTPPHTSTFKKKKKCLHDRPANDHQEAASRWEKQEEEKITRGRSFSGSLFFTSFIKSLVTFNGNAKEKKKGRKVNKKQANIRFDIESLTMLTFFLFVCLF